jgi:hypothetical protein
MVTTEMAGKFKIMFSDFLRSLHQLWLEVIGGLFIVFSLLFGFHAVKEYREYVASVDNPWGIIGAAALSVLTLGFGIHSFWKARKLR